MDCVRMWSTHTVRVFNPYTELFCKLVQYRTTSTTTTSQPNKLVYYTTGVLASTVLASSYKLYTTSSGCVSIIVLHI